VKESNHPKTDTWTVKEMEITRLERKMKGDHEKASSIDIL